MNKLYLLFSLLAALASACCTVRQLPSVSDSTRVEVRTETVTKTDTVTVELPVIIEKVATLDTLSVLENAYARSEAGVSEGILRHSLETKPVKLPVEVEHHIIYKDSLVFRDRVVTETVEVEREFTWWQKFRLHTGTAALALIAIAILYIFLKSINLFNLKRL